MLRLNDVTLVAIGSSKIKETRAAINTCRNQVSFNKTVFFTEEKNHIVEDGIQYIDIEPITTLPKYNSFRVLDFPKIFLPLLETSFYLIIEWDGFIVNPNAWTDEFFSYDYIGAPLPFTNICGNGGFTLRSKKFLTKQQLCSNKYKQFPEDMFLSLVCRSFLKEQGCNFAPTEIGYKFATETGDYSVNKSFGFHNFTLNPQFKNFSAKMLQKNNISLNS